MQRMNILVLSTFGVYPPSYGGQVRIFNLYKHLAAFADITILSYEVFDRDHYTYQIYDGLNLVCFRQTKNAFRMLRRLSAKTGLFLHDVLCHDGYEFSSEFIELVSSHAEKSDFVILSHPYLVRLLNGLHKNRVIYEAHNYEYGLKEQYFKTTLSTRMSANYLETVFDCEKTAHHVAGLSISVDADEASKAAGIYQLKNEPVVLENGIDTGQFSVIDYHQRNNKRRKLGLAQSHAICFTGSSYYANVDAADYIIKELSVELPDIAFFILGSVRNSVTVSIKTARENVYCFGFVSESEKASLMQACDLAINPVTTGAGTSLKMVEYIAAGLPVVATIEGARGMVSNTDCVAISARRNFKDTILSLLKNRDVLEKKARNCRRLAEEKYSWNVLAGRMKGLLEGKA